MTAEYSQETFKFSWWLAKHESDWRNQAGYLTKIELPG